MHPPLLIIHFEPRARRCIFVGYPIGQKAYRLHDLDTQKIFVSGGVVFYETIFSFKSDKALHDSHTNRASIPLPISDVDISLLPSTTTHSESTQESLPVNTLNSPSSSRPIPISNTHPQSPPNTSHISPMPSTTNQPLIPDPIDQHISIVPAPPPPPPRRSQRIHRPPTRLADYKCNMASADSSSSSSGSQYPISHYLCLNTYSHSHLHFINTITKHIEPTSFTVARKDPNWRQAMEDEIKALEANNT